MNPSATILLVEDDVSMLNGMRDLLEIADIGYEANILTAHNGQMGLEQMFRQKPDLIVSDINMPIMDGYQFLQEVRQNSDWLYIPFIFLTAKGDKHEIKQGRLSEADLYIVKPFNSIELIGLIQTQLDKANQLQQVRDQSVEHLKKGILQILNHEFRTPLTYVTAYYEMLSDSVTQYTDDQNFQEYLRGIQAGCIRLNKLIEDLLLVIELRTGEIKASFDQEGKPISDLSNVLQEVAITQQERIKNDNLNMVVEVAVPDNLPPIWGDRNSLGIVFNRLCRNAIKFSLPLTQTTKKIYLKAEVIDETIVVQVRDEGVGIPKQIQGQVFDVFFQHNRQMFEQQGAGLGLTIVKGLVDIHHGQIEIQSEEGLGSTFTIRLPIYDSDQVVAYSVVKQKPHKATILVVEDDHFLLLGLRELLEIYENGYIFKTLTAENGRQGLDVLATTTPDLIISDIMMPEMDGYEFLENVRNNPDWLQIPFIFLTAKGEREDIHQGRLSGVEEYITKPYDSDELLSLVVAQLDKYFRRKGIQAQSFNQLKRSILDLITPDFRLPLSDVNKYSEILADGLEDVQSEEMLKESLEGIQEGSMHLTKLVENFIALAELRTGEAETAYQLRAQPIFSVPILFAEATHACRDLAQSKGVPIYASQNSDVLPAYGDSLTLVDVLIRVMRVGLLYFPTEGQAVQQSIGCDEQTVWLSVRFDVMPDREVQANLAQILADIAEGVLDMAEYAPDLVLAKGYAELNKGQLVGWPDGEGYLFTLSLPVYEGTGATFS